MKRNHILVLITETTNNMATLENLGFRLPSLDLLNDYTKSYSPTQDEIDARFEQIKSIFDSFGVSLEIGDVAIGSNVTQYEFVPSKGTKLSKIKGLENDIALHLGVDGVRIIAPIRGKGVVGVEVPNIESNTVGLKNILTSDKDKIAKMDLPITLGETTTGKPYSFDLTKAPHVLIGGATSMGKSVGINVLLNSLILNIPSNILKFVMVDVKKVELSMYEDLEMSFKPNFINKMIYTETDEVVHTLNKVVSEMDGRYDMLKKGKCRTIKEYNEKFALGELSFNDGHEFLPYIVVVIDEFADLIMTVGKDIEFPITRLAQLSRAVGIHLVVATQRPTTTVITGGIKANFPIRIAYRVASNMDSRTILDCGGAENLIGKGDALVSSGINLDRIQTAWIDTDEIERIVQSIKKTKSNDDIW
jgi:S-DNA-T family DNA segregation ATPase FtsK/SpoIIIE